MVYVDVRRCLLHTTSRFGLLHAACINAKCRFLLWCSDDDVVSSEALHSRVKRQKKEEIRYIRVIESHPFA